MGCSESRDYTADIEKIDVINGLIKELIALQEDMCTRIDPMHDIYDNTAMSMWAAQLQDIVTKLRGDKESKKSKLQTTLSADELKNVILWGEKVQYEMRKADNVWLEDSDLSFLHTMKTAFITRLNEQRRENREAEAKLRPPAAAEGKQGEPAAAE